MKALAGFKQKSYRIDWHLTSMEEGLKKSKAEMDQDVFMQTIRLIDKALMKVSKAVFHWRSSI